MLAAGLEGMYIIRDLNDNIAPLLPSGQFEMPLMLTDRAFNSDGSIQFNIDGTGRSANPNVQGQIKIVNAAFAGDSLPVGLQNGNGVLTLTNNRLEIDSFNGKVSGGTLNATGGVTYRPSVQFNLAVAANGIRTLYPQGVREGIDDHDNRASNKL